MRSTRTNNHKCLNLLSNNWVWMGVCFFRLFSTTTQQHLKGSTIGTVINDWVPESWVFWVLSTLPKKLSRFFSNFLEIDEKKLKNMVKLVEFLVPEIIFFSYIRPFTSKFADKLILFLAYVIRRTWYSFNNVF